MSQKESTTSQHPSLVQMLINIFGQDNDTIAADYKEDGELVFTDTRQQNTWTTKMPANLEWFGPGKYKIRTNKADFEFTLLPSVDDIITTLSRPFTPGTLSITTKLVAIFGTGAKIIAQFDKDGTIVFFDEERKNVWMTTLPEHTRTLLPAPGMYEVTVQPPQDDFAGEQLN